MNDARVANLARALCSPSGAASQGFDGASSMSSKVVDQFVLRLLVLPDASWQFAQRRLVDLALAQGVDEQRVRRGERRVLRRPLECGRLDVVDGW